MNELNFQYQNKCKCCLLHIHRYYCFASTINSINWLSKSIYGYNIIEDFIKINMVGHYWSPYVLTQYHYVNVLVINLELNNSM